MYNSNYACADQYKFLYAQNFYVFLSDFTAQDANFKTSRETAQSRTGYNNVQDI